MVGNFRKKLVAWAVKSAKIVKKLIFFTRAVIWLKKNQIPITLIGTGLILLAVFLNFYDFGYIKTVEDNSLVKQIESCQENTKTEIQIKCYDSIFNEYLAVNSPEKLLEEFKISMDLSAPVRKDCHQIAHAMGRAALVKLGNISDVFQLDRKLDACAGGFFHGAIEKMFRTNDDVPVEQHIALDEFRKKIPTLCDQFEKIDRKSECIHGIGHGALFIQGDLKKSLDTCRLFPKSSDHFSCHSGVFMEYSISGQAKEDNKKDRYFPCNQFGESQRNACYYVHSFRLTDLGLSREELIKECRKAPGAGGGFCVRGYGIFFLAHEALAQGPKLIVEFCESLDKPNARVCAESVASRLAAHTENGQYAMPFCSMFKSDYISERCFAYTADVLRLGHKVDKKAIIEDCGKYADNPEECIKYSRN
ncbi:MAG: hypothetical protein Q8Q89_02225 [bacterium]|nr:hypothetical protein [bacterium]